MSLNPEETNVVSGSDVPDPARCRRHPAPGRFADLTPVWFRWDGSSVTIWTTDTRAGSATCSATRGRLLGPDLRAPYPAVVMRGARQSTSGDDAAVVDVRFEPITRRYVQPEEVEPYVDDWPALRKHRQDHPGPHHLLGRRRLTSGEEQIARVTPKRAAPSRSRSRRPAGRYQPATRKRDRKSRSGRFSRRL